MSTTTTRKLNQDLYTAAKKAGVDGELARAAVEVSLETYGGKTTLSLHWERELREREDFVFPVRAWDRAVEWARKVADRHGYAFCG